MRLTPKQQKQLAHYFFIESKNPQALAYFIKSVFLENPGYDFDDVFEIIQNSPLKSEETKAFITSIFRYLTQNEVARFVYSMTERKLPVEFAKDDGQSALREDSFTATLLSEQAKVLVQLWLSPLLIELISELKSFKSKNPEEPNWEDPEFSKKFTPIFLKYTQLIFIALRSAPAEIKHNIRLFSAVYLKTFSEHSPNQAQGFVLGSYLILRVIAPFIMQSAMSDAEIGAYLRIGIVVSLQKISLFVINPYSKTLEYKKESLYGTALREHFPKVVENIILPKITEIIEGNSVDVETGKTIFREVALSFDPNVVAQVKFNVSNILGKTRQAQLLQIIDENDQIKLAEFFQRWQENPTAIELFDNPTSEDVIILAPVFEKLFSESTYQTQRLIQTAQLLFLLGTSPDSTTIGDIFKSSSVPKAEVGGLRAMIQNQFASKQPGFIERSSADVSLENKRILNQLLAFLLKNLKYIRPVDLKQTNIDIVSFKARNILFCLANLKNALLQNDLHDQYKSLKEALLADEELMVHWLDLLIEQINSNPAFGGVRQELQIFLQDDFCFGVDFSKAVQNESSQTAAQRLFNKLNHMEAVILEQTAVHVENQISKFSQQLGRFSRSISAAERDRKIIIDETLEFWLSVQNYLIAKNDTKTPEGLVNFYNQKQALAEKYLNLRNQLVSFLIDIFKIPYEPVLQSRLRVVPASTLSHLPVAASATSAASSIVPPQLNSAARVALQRESVVNAGELAVAPRADGTEIGKVARPPK